MTESVWKYVWLFKLVLFLCAEPYFSGFNLLPSLQHIKLASFTLIADSPLLNLEVALKKRKKKTAWKGWKIVTDFVYLSPFLYVLSVDLCKSQILLVFCSQARDILHSLSSSLSQSRVHCCLKLFIFSFFFFVWQVLEKVM